MSIGTGIQTKHCPEEEMGKSRGALSTKIHAAVDALGNPFRLLPSPAIRRNGSLPVIPPGSNRKASGRYDKHLYRERKLVKHMFQKPRHHRRIATRHERLAVTCTAMLGIVSVFQPAYAYVDPGTASIILQAVIGAIAVAGVCFRGWISKAMSLFTPGRRKEKSRQSGLKKADQQDTGDS